MTWLFKLNLGVLFAAFSAISFWTQGVPRKLATLAGFVAGFLFLGFLAIDFLAFHWARVSHPWVRPLTLAVVWSAALVVGWPLVAARATPDWVYQHETRAVLCGLAWSVQAVAWVGASYPAFRVLSTGWLRTLAETSWFAGVLLQFLAATLIAGAPWMWPSHTREHAIDWYVWISQGCAMSLLTLGFLTTALGSHAARGWIGPRLPGVALLVVSLATVWAGMPAWPLGRGLGHLLMIGGTLSLTFTARETDLFAPRGQGA